MFGRFQIHRQAFRRALCVVFPWSCRRRTDGWSTQLSRFDTVPQYVGMKMTFGDFWSLFSQGFDNFLALESLIAEIGGTDEKCGTCSTTWNVGRWICSSKNWISHPIHSPSVEFAAGSRCLDEYCELFKLEFWKLDGSWFLMVYNKTLHYSFKTPSFEALSFGFLRWEFHIHHHILEASRNVRGEWSSCQIALRHTRWLRRLGDVFFLFNQFYHLLCGWDIYLDFVRACAFAELLRLYIYAKKRITCIFIWIYIHIIYIYIYYIHIKRMHIQ